MVMFCGSPPGESEGESQKGSVSEHSLLLCIWVSSFVVLPSTMSEQIALLTTYGEEGQDGNLVEETDKEIEIIHLQLVALAFCRHSLGLIPSIAIHTSPLRKGIFLCRLLNIDCPSSLIF